MSNITGESDSAASPNPSASPSPRDGDVWDVAEILAERTSLSGENELLVVWKHSWIPISNMHSDGPVMRKFRGTPKWKFNSALGMRLILPVEPGTVLADDCAAIVAAADAERAAASNSAASSSDLTPSPALGCEPIVSQRRSPRTRSYGVVAKPATQQQQKRRKASNHVDSP